MTAPVSLPLPSHGLPGPAGLGGRGHSAVRTSVALVMIASGVALLAYADVVRSLEAHAVGSIVGLLTSTDTYFASDTASFYWGMGTTDAFGLRVTPECSIAYVLGPLLVVFGLLGCLRRLPLPRVVAGVSIAVVFMTSANVARMVMIAAVVDRFGRGTPMWWAHTVAGSVLSTITVIVGLAMAVRTAFWTPRAERG